MLSLAGLNLSKIKTMVSSNNKFQNIKTIGM
jgi:hypothetical protein